MTTNYIADGSGQVDITVAGQSWVLNSGFTIASSGAGILVEASARIFNYGGIVSFSTGGVYFKDTGGYLLNGSTGSITGFDGVAIDGTAPETVRFVNFGQVVGIDLYGVACGGSRHLDFDNRGYCYGDANAVVIYGSASAIMTNYGAMESHVGPAVSVNTTSTDLVALSNYGDITGLVEVLNSAHFEMTNTGTMGGLNAYGQSTVINTGTMGELRITGEVATVNTVTNSGTTGDYSGGMEADIVGNSGHMGSVSLGGGDDVYAASGSGTSLQVRGGAGSDSITAGMDGQYFGEADDDIYVFLNAASIAQFNETGGTGKDTVVSAVDFSLSGEHVVGKIENLTLFLNAIVGTGNSLANVITGNDKDNLLSGLGGKDTLIGGAGADDLTGGSGNDRFTYKTAADSGITSATRDTIEDFVHGADKINVHAFDADTTVSGNQDFIFGGAFTAGHVKIAVSGTVDALLSFNTDGDAAAEMTILLKNFASASFDSGDLIG